MKIFFLTITNNRPWVHERRDRITTVYAGSKGAAIRRAERLIPGVAVTQAEEFNPTAYVVCHDCFDHGAMEIWFAKSRASAEIIARDRQEELDQQGIDGCFYRAYTVLPRKRVWKQHQCSLIA